MKIKELRNMDNASLNEKLTELKKELVKVNAQVAIGTALKNPGQVRVIKKTLARILTLSTEKDVEKSKQSEVDKKVPKHTAERGILGFLYLFKSPNLRMKTLIIYYMWFSTSFIYYGLTLNSNDYGASLFVSYSVGKGKL